jgi:bifunctional non-homologous end joining protein LigD
MDKIKPMLAHDIDHFDGRPPWGAEGWMMEIKWDGIRLLLRNDNEAGRLRYFARKGNEHTGRYNFLEPLSLPANTVLDGELVMPGGKSSDVSALVNRGQLVYVIFDVLQVDGHNLRSEPWRFRRDVLSHDLFRRFDRVTVAGALRPDEDVAAALMDQGHEGVVLKRMDARYYEGRRSFDWLKIKKAFAVDVVIIDCESPPTKGSLGDRSGWTCLTYGFYIDGKPVACGSVGQSEPRAVQEAKVGQVAEIKCNGVNRQNGALRHPRIVRFRPDKTPEECTL